MKIGYVKQTFKCLISEQVIELNRVDCLEIKTLPANNIDYVKSEISKLSKTDEIVVVKLIVLANSIQELLDLLQFIEVKKIKLTILSQNLLSYKPITLLHLLEALDEFVRDVIKQKQLLGIVRAKARGKHIGRPRKLNKKQLLKALDLREYYTNEEVAKMLKVSRSTLLRNVADYKNKAG